MVSNGGKPAVDTIVQIVTENMTCFPKEKHGGSCLLTKKGKYRSSWHASHTLQDHFIFLG